jgi:PRTRC genetic system protein C
MATIYKYPHGDYEYRDEEDELTTQQMQDHLRQYFPELANASVEESEDDEGNKVVTFVKRAGTKGALVSRANVLAAIRNVQERMTLNGEIDGKRHGPSVWLDYIAEEWGHASQDIGAEELSRARYRIVKMAALCVAALEQHGPVIPDDDGA